MLHFGSKTNSKTNHHFRFNQCDQMTGLCFQYLAIFSNFSNENVPKWAENFAQNQIDHKYLPFLKIFSKVVKFLQFWSHWLQLNVVAFQQKFPFFNFSEKRTHSFLNNFSFHLQPKTNLKGIIIKGVKNRRQEPV